MRRIAVIAAIVVSVGILGIQQKPAAAQSEGGPGGGIDPKTLYAAAFSIWSKWTQSSGFTSINSTSNLSGTTEVDWDDETGHYSAGAVDEGAAASYSANIYAAVKNSTGATITDGTALMYIDVAGASEVGSAGHATSQISLTSANPGDAPQTLSGTTTAGNNYLYDTHNNFGDLLLTLEPGQSLVWQGSCSGSASHSAP